MNDVMAAQMTSGAGFIAALDQSGGSTPGALEAYGIAKGSWADDDEMFALMHQMRVRVMTAPSFTNRHILAAILFERTIGQQIDGADVPAFLWQRGIVTFLKVDKGVEAEDDGVQVLKPIPGLDDLLDRARGLGIFGTKMRSVIKAASPTGIARIIAQQFEVGAQIADKGLMPILEPEVLIKTPSRGQAEAILRDEVLKQLDRLSGDRQVMLKLSIPEQADIYAPLIAHHRVMRVVALSGGFPRDEACERLAHNHGMIASFSRALLEELRHGMDDAEFDRLLKTAIDEIYDASVAKS